MTTDTHPLFKAYPLTGEQAISTGVAPTPYHIYDGHGTLIGGTADLQHVQNLLKNEHVHPIQTENGRALIAIWLVDFTKASLAPHNELQISILVSHQPCDPVKDHPLILIEQLFSNPKARMLCYALGNNTETAVAYNRELLGLPAQLIKGTIERENGVKRFVLSDTNGRMLCQGEINEAKTTPPAVGWSLLRLLGLRQTIRAATQKQLEAFVVNPINDVIPYNADATSYLAADTPIMQFFDPRTDQLELGFEFAIGLRFQPLFCEHFSPFRFVYLMPQPPSS